LRDRTEAPIRENVDCVLAGSDPHRIVEAFGKTYRSPNKTTRSPESLDGSSARRIVQILMEDHFRQSQNTLTAARCSLREMGSDVSARTL
jgi:hypothetical protein